MSLPLLLALAGPTALGAPHPDGPTPGATWQIWHGDQLVTEVGAPAAGRHLGGAVQVGAERLRPAWTWGHRPELVGPSGQLLPSPGLPTRQELIIVTTTELAGASELLPRLIETRRAEGFEVTLATEADWDQPVAQGTDGRADRIRAWLADGWADRPGAFLLLIGDPHPVHGDVPMKDVHPLLYLLPWYPEWMADEDPLPTDLWYSDLTGSWDCDGDELYGEYPDDGPCVDFGPELFVGRLPVYDGNVTLLDGLLRRTLARDQEQDKSYRGDILLPGAMISLSGAPSPVEDDYDEDTDGASILDTLHRDLPPAFQDRATRLYEDDGLTTSVYPHEGSLSRDQVVAEWADGRGLVVWTGHGSPEGAFRMIWAEDADGDGQGDLEEFDYPGFILNDTYQDLPDEGGAFTFHVSCSNGVPEDEHNIGAMLLRGGAVGTVSASRVAYASTAAWGEVWEPRPDLAMSSTAAYYWALELTAGRTVGEAVAYTKYALSGDGWGEGPYSSKGVAWATKMQFNLYGDPTRSLELCSVASDCDDGSPCNGTETCDDGFCVHSAPIDCSGLDDQCVVGSCDAATGNCVTEPRVDGAVCDDGSWCTEADVCSAGVCSGVDRDCGSREGYLATCDEELGTCTWEEEPAGCSHLATPRGWMLLGALPLLGLRRRRTLPAR